jgi:hypothetical protein
LKPAYRKNLGIAGAGAGVRNGHFSAAGLEDLGVCFLNRRR